MSEPALPPPASAASQDPLPAAPDRHAALAGLALLLACQAVGEALARALALPVPGPVVGMALAWPLLHHAPSRRAIRAVADVLLGHLSLLFVPVGVGVVTHLDTLGSDGARLMAVIAVSTAVGLAATALVLRTLLARAGASLVDIGEAAEPRSTEPSAAAPRHPR